MAEGAVPALSRVRVRCVSRLGGKGRKGPGSPVESLKGALEMSRTHGAGSVDCMGTDRSELRPVSVLERKPVDLWVPVINPFVYGSGGPREEAGLSIRRGSGYCMPNGTEEGKCFDKLWPQKCTDWLF